MVARARTIFTDSVQRFIKSNPSKRQVHLKLASLERFYDELVHFVPWPALQESFQRDIKTLRGMIEDV